MNLKNIILKKGYRTKQVEVPEWEATVTVREPMHVHFNRYIKSSNEIDEDADLTKEQKDLAVINAEARLFITILIDENGDPMFKNNEELDDLFKSYGPVHTRLLNHAVALMELGKEPIKEAEKK